MKEIGRREDFARTMHHEKPENLIIDFGGNPLSSMEGESENKLLEFLGFGKNRAGTCRLEKHGAWTSVF